MPKTIKYTCNTLGSKPRSALSHMNIQYMYKFGEKLRGIYSQNYIGLHNISFETWKTIA